VIQMPSFEQSVIRHRARDNTRLMSMYGRIGKMREKTMLVPLDIFFDKKTVKKRISFVKIDVEGNEVQALERCQRMIDEHAPAFEIEINRGALKLAGNEYSDILRFLGERSYKPYRFDGRELFEIKDDPEESIFDATFIRNGRKLF
jgi:hypothetical protein